MPFRKLNFTFTHKSAGKAGALVLLLFGNRVVVF
jgi:hypothetical protein